MRFQEGFNVTRKSFCLPFIFVLVLFASLAEAVPNQNIKIGVAPDAASGQLLGKGLSLRGAEGKKLSVSSGARVSASGEYLRVGPAQLKMPVLAQGGSELGWDKTRYRGTLTFIRSPRGFTVVNELDMESYLRGILKMEMNPEWPREALRAQAILARTFAVKNKGRFASKGYDLDATENSQVYRGRNAEDPRTDAAVSATAGQVLTYNGQIAAIYYHSDSGGSTADVSHVWGGSVPYLTGKKEQVSYQSPYSNWTLALSPAQVQAALSKMSVNIGAVSGMSVSRKDASGRAVQLNVQGDRGAADVRAHAFRMAVGASVLRSTNFDLSSGARETAPVKQAPPVDAVFSLAADPLVEMTRNGVFTKDEMMDMLMNPEKRDDYLKMGLGRISPASGASSPPAQQKPEPVPAPRTPVAAPASGFTLIGRGWGHGVGLSQWGAKAMAEQGASCDAILGHYFPGTKIAR